jgi:hypothetical protein
VRKLIRNIRVLLCFIIIAIVALISISFYKNKYQNSIHNAYNINVVFDDEKMRLDCKETLSYINTENTVLNELYFHIYPNAFKNEEKVPISKDELAIAYPKGFSEGYIEINEVKIGNNVVPFHIEGENETILHVKLNSHLKQGQLVDIIIDFTVQLPPCISRFGYGKHSINVTNWYPILCVYDESGWNKDPYYSIGDPFYSDVSNYKVDIDIAGKYIVAHTGILKETNNTNDRVRYSIQANKVRDFAWFASNSYETIENIADGTVIRSYSYSGNAMKALEIATKALKTFNDLFGKYPYDTLSIAESDFYVGGMEYPQIVQIDSTAYNGDKLWLEYLITHEIAHQWWYGVVGNDEIEEPWLDEGLTEYSTILYFEKNYGKKQKDEIMNSFIKSNIERFGMNSNTYPKINRSLSQFNNWQEYSALVYSKGAMIHEDLRALIGDEKYYKLLRKYYNKYKFQNAKIRDFVKLSSEIAGRNLKGYLEQKLGNIAD